MSAHRLTRATRLPRAALSRGLSLIELLVALAIGAVLIFGATQVYVDSRAAYGVNETVGRLQESARYAMTMLESDVRMAGYWGLVKGTAAIKDDSWSTEAGATAAVAASTAANVCGNNFAVDVSVPVTGFNNRYALSATQTAGCDALSGWTTTAVADADTLIVRHAAITATTAVANVLQVCSNRMNAYLMSDGGAANACTDSDPATPLADRSQSLNDMMVDAYYVDQNSDEAVGMPSLRRKRLCINTATVACGGVTFVDEEVIAGVEDMQVQFGVETNVIANPLAATAVAQRYVDPESVPAGAQIVSVRLWLRVRADAPEVGFVDGRAYTYGDKADVAVDAGAQGFRRLLVSRTIKLRNAMGT
jgi:type IV pilus assembly protein PilW